MFDTLENYILTSFPISCTQLPFPAHRLQFFPKKCSQSLTHLFYDTPGPFFQLLAAEKFHPILILIKPIYSLIAGKILQVISELSCLRR